ncbi:MAG: hypothetical protein GXP10_06820 [Gammaproteobacteria bacterium]|nr:hypothetical protein [Gammaproteobacteria bacterium]
MNENVISQDPSSFQPSSQFATTQDERRQRENDRRQQARGDRRTGDDRRLISRDGLVVRTVDGDDELDQVYRLIHDAYVEQGYCQPRADGRLIYHETLTRSPQTHVLLAKKEDEVVGTLSATLEGPLGLPLDPGFHTAHKRIAREKRALSVIWRLATHRDYRQNQFVVMELIKLAVLSSIQHGAITALCVFHDHHEKLYQRLFKMESMARCNTVDGFNNETFVMMRCDAEKCPPRWLPN